MGGHLAHGWDVSVMGKWFHSVQYTVQHDSGRVDLDEVRDLARRERPKLIFCGGTAIPRTIDFPGFAEIAGEVGGAHPSPVGHAGVISTTTHKTLRGPRGAISPRGWRWRCTRPPVRSSATTPRRSSPTPSGWRRCSPSVASTWCPVAPTTTCC